MSTVTTQKRIDLKALDSQLGDVGVTVYGNADSTDSKEIVADVPLATLQSAVDAHQFIDRTANRAAIEQRAADALAANLTYIDRASPTAAQSTAQVRALSQQMNGVIRLLLNRLDGTD